MKKHLSFYGLLLLTFLITISCQPEEDLLLEESNINEIELNTDKSNGDFLVVCSTQGIPPGFELVQYLNVSGCPNYNLFPGGFNAALVQRNDAPQIFRAGAGCNDNYCIWIVGENFEPEAYIDVRTTTGETIIGTYRGSDRQINISANGDDTMSIRLRSEFERQQFAQNGLRIWVVNPEARKWADGRTVRRPRDFEEPPCDPICP
ncbi:hypothetical protein [Aquimarina litoralis]|uniref:hypothetical protein n=1 Tax=Aquimarina litoralis TaxID=584605 RepID=UPI001C561510|nr:hypothetical protein [Aquimarina litoralis]MBW1298250.1 hypothetical protein [Aquimarina litoralis]